jgi:hypothetical protein
MWVEIQIIRSPLTYYHCESSCELAVVDHISLLVGVVWLMRVLHIYIFENPAPLNLNLVAVRLGSSPVVVSQSTAELRVTFVSILHN